jgi:hypothetical protein
VRRHFIDMVTPEQLAQLRASLTPIADQLRKRRGKA